MKAKLLLLFALVAVFLLPVNVFAAEAEQAPKPVEVPDIRIIIDSKLEKFEKVPISVNNSTLLPLRELLVKLGVPNDDEHIIYNHGEKSVTVWDGQTKIYLKIGQKEAFVNDKPILLNAAPILYKNSTYIPLRFVAESMGKKVVWDGETRSVLICDADKYDAIKQILEKTADEMADVKKYKQYVDLTGDIVTGGITVNLSLDSTALADIQNKKMYINMQMNVLGMQIPMESYWADNAYYASNPFTGQWSKVVYNEVKYDMYFKETSGNNVVNNYDILCTGFNRADSENDDEILLKGDFFFNEFLKYSLTDILSEQDISNASEYDDVSMEISINKNTYLVNYIRMDMKISKYEPETGDKMTGSISIKVEYDDYDGDFEITVPEYVLKNAVLTEDKSADLREY